MIPKMGNFLDSGSILPSGLLSASADRLLEGYKKTFQNYYLRVGIIKETYEINDSKNFSKLFPEYDVLVFEQNEDKSSTVITYKNCLAAASFGSIADFFEAKLRKMKSKKTKGVTPSISGQNGAIVLLLCLNGLSEKGIIVGALPHPDRKTTLSEDGLHLEGEYNGVNIKIENDGSATLTFKGATDNDGKVIDSSQGNTTVKIEKDGSYQIEHKTIKQRLDKNGDASLSTDGSISNTAKKDFNINASENINISATKNFSSKCVDFILNASGSAILECQKMSVQSQSEISFKGSQFKAEAESLASIKSSSIVLDGNVSLGGNGGQPVLMLNAMIIGTGNKGRPVVSYAVSGFTTKVTAR